MQQQLAKLQQNITRLKNDLASLRKQDGLTAVERQERILVLQERIANRRKTFFQEGLTT